MRSMMEARAVRRTGAQVALGAALMMTSGWASAQSAQQPTTTQQQPTTTGQQPTTTGQQPTTTGQQPTTTSQQPAQPTDPAAAQAPTKPQLTFDSDYVVWFYAVKGENTQQFEQFFTRVKEAMAKSPNPERKTQAAGMKLLKATSPAADGTVNYVLMINPVVRAQEYSPGMLLFEVFPTEAKELVDQLQSYINDKGLNAAVPLTTVMPLGGM